MKEPQSLPSDEAARGNVLREFTVVGGSVSSPLHHGRKVSVVVDVPHCALQFISRSHWMTLAGKERALSCT